MRSNLHNTMRISSSKRFMSSSIMTIAIKSLKKMLNFVKACHIAKGVKLVGCKWVFKKKEGIPRVESSRFKARLMA